MGTATKILKHTACEPNVLRTWFMSRCENERAEYGFDPYSGSLGTKLAHGLEIHRTVYATADEAEEALDDRADKYGPALAAKVREPSKAALKKLKTLDTRIARIREATEAGAYRPKAYEQTHRDALERVQKAKSKTKGCSQCGSAIATSYIKHTACPVCQNPKFVLTSTEQKRIESAAAKQAKGEAQIEKIELEKNTLIQQDKSDDYHWLIVAACPE